MSDQANHTADLAKRVHGMIWGYVNQRTEAKSGTPWEHYRDKKIAPQAQERYREVRENVCQDAFLAMRACRAREDFVSYFTGTICAVPQYLPKRDYQALADALLGHDDAWEGIKSLAMLALSAVSRV